MMPELGYFVGIGGIVGAFIAPFVAYWLRGLFRRKGWKIPFNEQPANGNVNTGNAQPA
ncbi:MAG: hypothetical protein IJ228_13415 [Succinivibrio sp.]|nr:hypothetical protein [Succinivibrio sp.]